MALPKIERIDIHFMDQWFSNLVDSLNFNIAQIEKEVPALANQLQHIDAAPIQYLKNSLQEMVKKVNTNFDQIGDNFANIDFKINEEGS